MDTADSKINEKNYNTAYLLLRNIRYIKSDKNYDETLKLLDDSETKAINAYFDDIESLYHQRKYREVYDLWHQVETEFPNSLYKEAVVNRHTKIAVTIDGKMSEIKRADELKNAPEPKIGMNMQEIENSKWGYPLGKNKIVTEQMTSEQWVYSDNRYIYFDNGKVTTIQTH